MVVSPPASGERDRLSDSLSRAARGQLLLAVTATILATLSLGPGGNRAEAYRFYDNGALDYIVGSDEALRWSADAWGRGQTLVWEIEDGEDWSLLLDSAEDVRPLIEEALGIWSGIETADISWRLGSVAAATGDEPRFGDSRHRVFLERQHWRDRDGNQRYSYRSGAFLWSKRSRTRSAWELAECDVGLPWGWWLDDDLQPEAGLDLDDVRGRIVRFTADAFGHCLGLGAAVSFPGSPRLRRAAGSEETSWRGRDTWDLAPLMGNYWQPLSDDDRAGASLLRPRPGWPSTVGSVTGNLHVGGTPVPYVHVYAIRSTPEGVRNPVGAFANFHGEFLIEGLTPGEYVLWALPIREFWSQRPLVLEDAEVDVKDAVLTFPVRVEAGQTTDGITIPMRRGRQ